GVRSRPARCARAAPAPGSGRSSFAGDRARAGRRDHHRREPGPRLLAAAGRRAAHGRSSPRARGGDGEESGRLSRRIMREPPGAVSCLLEQLLKGVGDDAEREGLERTPERVEKSLRYLTSGYRMDVQDVLNDALFVEEYDEMVVVKDIDVFSLCVPSKQIVNAVGGARPARVIRVGD